MNYINFVFNHLLFIDDLKLLPKNELILKEMIEETKQFLKRFDWK